MSVRDLRADLELVAIGAEDRPGRVLVDPRDRAGLVEGDEAGADVDRRRLQDLTVIDQSQLGCAAAHVDVEEAPVVVLGQADGAGAVGGEQGLVIGPGRGADELSDLLREHLDDWLGVLFLQGLAGDDDGAAVHVLRLYVGQPVGFVDELLESLSVDQRTGGVGREEDAGLKQHRALRHLEGAGEALAAQHQLGEDQVRGRGADVDADAFLLERLQPEEVLGLDDRSRRKIVKVLVGLVVA